jgi:hypothetical protein
MDESELPDPLTDEPDPVFTAWMLASCFDAGRRSGGRTPTNPFQEALAEIGDALEAWAMDTLKTARETDRAAVEAALLRLGDMLGVRMELDFE